VAVDASGNVYVADTLNERICKIDSSGNLKTVAGAFVPGTPGTPGYVDGPGGEYGGARFSGPTGLTVTSLGIIYVADTGNNRIREIDGAENVTTLAGDGQSSVADGTLGPAGTAEFLDLTELILDGNGTLYVSDNDQIRKVVP
jgi:sugar lactone lactonase YvrE